MRTILLVTPSLLLLLIISCKHQITSTLNHAPQNELITLQLRVHLMHDVEMEHPSGVIMEPWVTEQQFRNTIMPEVNKIWSAAGIEFKIESILKESVIKPIDYDQLLATVINAKRDENGKSDPNRLEPLFKIMDPAHRTPELGPIFHIYLFPFIGNTSQGNSMRRFGYHTVVGTWTNKHNRGGPPKKTLLLEPWDRYSLGSLARTIAHEEGHVLGLGHKQCEVNCLMSGTVSNGYFLTDEQIKTARQTALERNGQNP